MTLAEMTHRYKLKLTPQQVRSYNYLRTAPSCGSLNDLEVLNITLTPDQRRKLNKVRSKEARQSATQYQY